jgi:chromosome segregation ATPase
MEPKGNSSWRNCFRGSRDVGTSQDSKPKEKGLSRCFYGLRSKDNSIKLQQKDDIIAGKDREIGQMHQELERAVEEKLLMHQELERAVEEERRMRQESERAVEEERRMRQGLEETIKDLQEKLGSATQENRNMQRAISEQLSRVKDLGDMAQRRWKNSLGHFEANGWEGVRRSVSSIQSDLEKCSNSSLNSSEPSTSGEVQRARSF